MKNYSWRVLFLLVHFLFASNLYTQQTNDDAGELSLDSLLNIKVNTAAKYWQRVNEAPASVTIVTAKQIERYGYRTIEDVLRNVRGFYTSYDRNYSFIGVRGFSRPTDYNSRLLLLLDGHTLNENIYGAAMVGNDLPLDLTCLDRIEIIRGPGSALYGTGAMFAVVNLIPRKGKALDKIFLSTELGSFNRIGGSIAIGKELTNGLDILCSFQGADIRGDDIYFPEYDNSTTNYGLAVNLDWERYVGFLTSVRYKQWAIQGMFTSRKKSIPTGAYGALFNTAGFESLDERGLLELKYEQPLSLATYLHFRGYYDYYHYHGSFPYPTYLNSEASIGKWFGSEFQFRWDAFGGNRLTIGAEIKNNLQADYRNWTSDSVYFDNNFPFTLFSLYLQDEYQMLENLAITVGIRRDEYSTTGSSTTPRIAVVVNPTTMSAVKLLYGEGFRSPNIYETNYEDPIPESPWITNPNLHPEKIITTEVVYEQKLTKNFFGVLSCYMFTMNDLIEPFEDTSGSSQFQNISEAEANGIEAELNFFSESGITGDLCYTYQNARDPSLSRQLSNSPSHIARLGLAYRLFTDVRVATEFIYNSERITVYRNTTDPFILTNVNVSVHPNRSDETFAGDILHRIECSLLVNNLFNTTYSTPGGIEHLQPSITQDGRNFRLKLTLSL